MSLNAREASREITRTRAAYQTAAKRTPTRGGAEGRDIPNYFNCVEEEIYLICTRLENRRSPHRTRNLDRSASYVLFT